VRTGVSLVRPIKVSTDAHDKDTWLGSERKQSFANFDVIIIIIAAMLFFGVWALGVSPFENPLLFLMAVLIFLFVLVLRYGLAKALFGGIRKPSQRQ